MADFDSPSIVLTGIGLIITLAYYALTIRNQNRTRQAQLLWSIYDSYRSIESRQQSNEISSWEWEDINDFFEKYGQQNNPEAWITWTSKAAYFNGIGILLRARREPNTLNQRMMT